MNQELVEELAALEDAVRFYGELTEQSPGDFTFELAYSFAWALLLDFCAETGMQHCFEDTTNEDGNRPPLRGELVQMGLWGE